MEGVPVQATSTGRYGVAAGVRFLHSCCPAVISVAGIRLSLHPRSLSPAPGGKWVGGGGTRLTSSSCASACPIGAGPSSAVAPRLLYTVIPVADLSFGPYGSFTVAAFRRGLAVTVLGISSLTLVVASARMHTLFHRVYLMCIHAVPRLLIALSVCFSLLALSVLYALPCSAQDNVALPLCYSSVSCAH